MEPVITIPALGDNYIYLYRYNQNSTFVVDPGDAGVVLKALEKQSLNLTHVLATHRHFDHTAGMEDLKKKTDCKALAPEKAEILNIGNVNIQVIATPGHTRDSVCYYVQPSDKHSGVLFTGDTLFIGGCGRPIGCDASTMWDSLQKIAALPDDTLIYPGNKVVAKYLRAVKEWQKQSKPTVPSNIGRERATNVFLRSDDPQIKAAINMNNATDSEVFAELRRRKNMFG